MKDPLITIRINKQGFEINKTVSEGQLLTDILNMYAQTAELIIKEHTCADPDCELVAFNKAILKNMGAVNEKFSQIRDKIQ